MIFNLHGYILSVAMDSLFLSGMCVVLFPHSINREGDISVARIKARFITSKTPIMLRFLLLKNMKSVFIIIAFFTASKINYFLKLDFLASWEQTLNFIGVFCLIILFELIQDLSLEKHSNEYNKLRLYKVANIGYFKRTLISRYAFLSLVAVLFTFLINITQVKIFVVNFLLILMLVFWYKFFEERALINRSKPTWQLSLIRSWIPTTIIIMLALAPRLVSLVRILKG